MKKAKFVRNILKKMKTWNVNTKFQFHSRTSTGVQWIWSVINNFHSLPELILISTKYERVKLE